MGSVIIIMGVSGSGKSTVGKLLAKELDYQFFDADEYHPQSNVDKMNLGTPLTDEDRLPWLNILSDLIYECRDGKGMVLACSALKESYRNILGQSGTAIDWVYLKGNIATITKRMNSREGHYMKSNLLQSQFDVLEEPTHGIQVSIESDVSTIVGKILAKM